MKEILLMSPFSLQGTYANNNLQKKDLTSQKDVRNLENNFLTKHFFNEKKLNKLYQLKNELSKVNCLYFVITQQILHQDFNDYFISLIMAINYSRPELIIIDTSICNKINNSRCKEIIAMITTVFNENQLPVVHLEEDSLTSQKTLHYSCVSPLSVDKKLLFDIHQHVKKIFSVKSQLTNTDEFLVPVASQSQKTFKWQNHSYNLN
ncbi:hypothetical protein [Aquimarina agarivorans]|uniref:hypothetical protein n=1 Tax=Aquimarina agarivorans TaxID=980584 RepID=UPI000248EAC8|nr:hypothetical protein [Aquimarina agarivorans]